MAQSKPPKPTTILIVEDEALVRLELTDRLTEMGFIVLAADDADGAIDMLDIHPEIALLLTDIRMPGTMDGLRLAHRVRDRWPPVKIIIASGMLATTAADLPADSLFLAKPYAPAALSACLMRSLGDRPARDGAPRAA